MNREIKFRAWVDKQQSAEFPFAQEPYMAIQGSPDIETLQSFMFHYSDEKNLMQWTGLKDKNGKDIYEGDILSAKRTATGIPLENGKIMEVFGPHSLNVEKRTWDEVVVAEIKVTENSMGFELPKEGQLYQERGKPLQWEIIGNIYEHPELIKV